MSKHTPTPWVVSDTAGFNFGHISSTPDGNGDIATTWHDLAKEDAAFIVRAVNSHDDMLAALKKSATFVQMNGEGSDQHLLNEICAAIIKAESKS